jgi:hypothetical protein
MTGPGDGGFPGPGRSNPMAWRRWIQGRKKLDFDKMA